jgi:hypothetical protein
MPLPLPPPARDVGAIPFAGAQVFLKAEANVVNEMPDTVIADFDPALVQFRQQFASGDVRLLFNTSPYPCFFIGQREGFLPPIGNAAGLPVSARRLVQLIADEGLTW